MPTSTCVPLWSNVDELLFMVPSTLEMTKEYGRLVQRNQSTTWFKSELNMTQQERNSLAQILHLSGPASRFMWLCGDLKRRKQTQADEKVPCWQRVATFPYCHSSLGDDWLPLQHCAAAVTAAAGMRARSHTGIYLLACLRPLWGHANPVSCSDASLHRPALIHKRAVCTQEKQPECGFCMTADRAGHC